MRAETSSIEAAMSKADDPYNKMAAHLSKHVVKTVETQLANDAKKIQLLHQDNTMQMNRSLNQLRQYMVVNSLEK